MAPVPAASAPGDLTGLSIVLVGPFDPLLIQPAKLLEVGLLDAADMEQLRYDVIAPEISALRLPWIQLIIENNKLTAATTIQSPMAEPVRDFVLGLYEEGQIRMLTAVGLNHEAHFATSSVEAWHKIGNLLAPKDVIWTKVLRSPGMLSLTIQAKRDDDRGGNLNVKVEPSTRIQPGVYVNLNDSMVSVESAQDGREDLIAALSARWEDSRQCFDTILAGVKGLAS